MATSTARRLMCKPLSFALLAASAITLAACGTPQKEAKVQKRSKEYFAESEYGVKASPRVTTKASRLARGGGRDQIGKPYMVKGKWYYPKEVRNYKTVGAASWYGDAFHGRLTANGEIYDMTHLTAAHPTMPLPSYARVTNLANGSSVIVRVNDRGPYAHNRVIDLSKRAAQMLDYDHVGVAQVKVEYVGRAPLDGLDESYLMASYKPGKDAAPVRGGAPEVMVAMAGSTPSGRPSTGLPPFPGMMTDSRPVQAKAPVAMPAVSRLPEVQVASASSFASVFDASDPVLPEFGPIVPERPMVDFAATGESVALPVLGYADQRVARAAEAFAALDRGSPRTAGALTAEAIVAAWKRGQKTAPAEGVAESYVMVGTYGSAAESARLAHELSAYGRVAIRQAAQDGAVWYSLDLHPDGRTPLDGLLQQAWAHGAADAMTVRE